MQRNEVRQVLDDPLARELMQSRIPVRLAYTSTDGTPRVVPLGFHWNGARFVICTVPGSAKVGALVARPDVALTIDTETFPPRALLVRGTASLETVDGVPPEYLEASRKSVGDAGMPAFEAQVRELYQQMVRITIEPHWAKLLDFETRLPSPVEKLIRSKQQQMPAGSKENAWTSN
ncbi:MAG: pyridoxamine 5'-phosphate oxidase family protein [Chloroflexi bacterium]|nr:pyridoxamine 5'-phosphate oxidase family protein [Chloroflexota bacterium]